MSTDQAAAFVESLLTQAGLQSCDSTLNEWVKQGEFGLLAAISTELSAKGADFPLEGWVIAQILGRIERMLALSLHPRALDALIAMLSLPRQQRDEPGLAAILASKHPWQALLPLFSHYAGQVAYATFLLYLAQELVIRLSSCADLPPVVAHVQQMRAQKHPLATLPLSLSLELENELDQYLPSYPSYSAGQQLPYWRPGNVLLPVPPSQLERAEAILANCVVQEQASPAARQAAAHCLSDWSRVELRSFLLAEPLTEAALSPTFLCSLGLKALAGGTPDQLTISYSSASEAFTMLFYAAAYGGAYGRGQYPAQARLHTWQAFQALANIKNTDDVEALEHAMLGSRWWNIQAETPWFTNDYDLFLVMLTPDRQRFITIAATSTD